MTEAVLLRTEGLVLRTLTSLPSLPEAVQGKSARVFLYDSFRFFSFSHFRWGGRNRIHK
jgi:hypothetical protein